jgi:hypothetical protein
MEKQNNQKKPKRRGRRPKLKKKKMKRMRHSADEGRKKSLWERKMKWQIDWR